MFLAHLEQRMRISIDAPAQGSNRIPHLVRVGSGGENTVLRTLELRRSDHFHRFGDLLGLLDGIDLPPDGLKAGHKEVIRMRRCTLAFEGMEGQASGRMESPALLSIRRLLYRRVHHDKQEVPRCSPMS